MKGKTVAGVILFAAGAIAAAYAFIKRKPGVADVGQGEDGVQTKLNPNPATKPAPSAPTTTAEDPGFVARARAAVSEIFTTKDTPLDAPVRPPIANFTRSAAGARASKQPKTLRDNVAEFFAGMLGIADFPTKYDNDIIAAAQNANVSPRVLKSLVISESSINPNAVGPRGERGLAQFTAPTWKEWSKKIYGEELPFHKAHDPKTALPIAAAYLRWLLDRTRGEYQPALAAYNGGIGNLQKGELPSVSWKYADKILKRVNAKSGLPDGI